MKTFQNLDTAFHDLQLKKLFENDKIKLNMKLIVDAKGAEHLVLYDSCLITRYFADVQRLFIDGTFKTTPKLENAIVNYIRCFTCSSKFLVSFLFSAIFLPYPGRKLTIFLD